jgi:phosphohistidine phosphatase
MPRLIVMRHAKSSWDDPTLDDFDRPLNGRGRKSATAMGDWLRDQGFLPDMVLCSSAMRTSETFERLRLQCPARFEQALYHSTAQTILSLIRTCTAQTLLVIWHNPGLGDFANRIVAAPASHPRFWDFPTCATLVADCPDDWATLTWGAATPEDFTIPRDLLPE